MVNKKTKQNISSCCSDNQQSPLQITPFEELTPESKKAYFKSSIVAAKGLVKQLKKELFIAQRSLNRTQKDYEKFKKKQSKASKKK